MTALAVNANRLRRTIPLMAYPVATATTIYKGGIVALTDAGFLVPASDTANLRVVGVAHEKVVNAGADGAVLCRVESGALFRFAFTSITQAMLGDPMFVVDDNTLDETTTNSVPVGRLLQFESVTLGWVYIPEGGARKQAAAADGTYSANEQAILNDIVS